jgi:predicted nucleic acid-binding protein
VSFLLDINVLSETRKRLPHQKVITWLQQRDQTELYISVLTLGELAKGIARRRKTDQPAAANLAHWLDGIELLFSDRIIPIDPAIASVWGELNADRNLAVIDSLLAATAKVYDLTLVTRNIKDIETTGVKYLNPWDQT